MHKLPRSFVAFGVRRLKDPKTYIGLGLLAVALGAPRETVSPIVQAIGLIVGGGVL